MPTEKTRVLTAQQVDLKIQRIAWEIYEKHVDQSEVVFVGISKSGFWLAKRILKVIKNISPLQCELIEMEVFKKDPLKKPVVLNAEINQLDGKCVILIDDVLSSGKVLSYGVRHLLSRPLHKLTTAVLVDRNHKTYPIKADVKGLSLSTSIQEHVVVEIKKEKAEVFLC